MKRVSSLPAIDSFLHVAAFSNTSEAGESACFPVLPSSGCRVGIFTAERLYLRWETHSHMSFLPFVWAHPWSSGLCPCPTVVARTSTIPCCSRDVEDGGLTVSADTTEHLDAGASPGAHVLASELRIVPASFFPSSNTASTSHCSRRGVPK